MKVFKDEDKEIIQQAEGNTKNTAFKWLLCQLYYFNRLWRSESKIILGRVYIALTRN